MSSGELGKQGTCYPPDFGSSEVRAATRAAACARYEPASRYIDTYLAGLGLTPVVPPIQRRYIRVVTTACYSTWQAENCLDVTTAGLYNKKGPRTGLLLHSGGVKLFVLCELSGIAYRRASFSRGRRRGRERDEGSA